MNFDRFKKPQSLFLIAVIAGTALTYILISLTQVTTSFVFDYIVKIHIKENPLMYLAMPWILATIFVVMLSKIAIDSRELSLNIDLRKITTLVFVIACMPVALELVKIFAGRVYFINDAPQPFEPRHLMAFFWMWGAVTLRLCVFYGIYKAILRMPEKFHSPVRTGSLFLLFSALMLNTYFLIAPCCPELPDCPRDMSCNWGSGPIHREGCYECHRRDCVVE